MSKQVTDDSFDSDVISAAEPVLVDFKTNRPPPTDPGNVAKIYLRQMAAYHLALQNIYPGRVIRCALLWTVGPQLMPLTAEQLVSNEP